MQLSTLFLIISLLTTPVLFAQSTQQIGSTLVTIDTLSTDVTIPWEIKVEGDDYLWVTERGGLVSRIDLLTGNKTVVLDLTSTIHAVSESGLLGMVLHPNFPGTPEVFLVYTYGPEDNDGYFKERLVKYTFNGVNLVNENILVDDILAWQNHNGSRLFVLPDNTLLMSTGECYVSQLAQDENSLNGKYLRVNMDGSVPTDNPTPGSYVYSLGHRNSQGICQLPDGKILISEHGPTTDDELQILEAGNNYGWPLIHGFCDQAFENTPCATGLYTAPIYAWTPTIATSDLVYYENWSFPEWNNRVLMVTLNGMRLVAIDLNGTSSGVDDIDEYFGGQFGRLRDIAIGPNKEVYIATNSGDNAIIRITPPYFVGVNETVVDDLLITPNPAENHIQFSNAQFVDAVILDMNGQLILKKAGIENQTIDISQLESGSYIVQILDESGGIRRQKFVKL